MAENAPPGWYQSEADPPGTERYWDGTQWSAETRSAVAPPPVVATGRTTPHGRELGSAGARVGARLIDFIILGVVTAPLIAGGLELDGGGLDSFDLPASRVLLSGLISALYEIGFTTWKSATPGKMLVGLEIVQQADGVSPLPLQTAVLRWLPFAVGNIPGISNLGFFVMLGSLILIFVDDYRRSVSDFVASTYVVRKPRVG